MKLSLALSECDLKNKSAYKIMEFIRKRLKSLQYVFQGLFYLIKNEPPVMVHIAISLVWVILGFCFGITTNEWIVQLLCIAIVLSVEGLNTAVEKSTPIITKLLALSKMLLLEV